MYRILNVANTSIISSDSKELFPVIRFIQAVKGKKQNTSGNFINNPTIGGIKQTISMGIITMRNWFKFEILEAAIIPSIVKIADDKAVPTAIPSKCLLPETKPNINAIIVEIVINAIVFESMYSDTFTGDTTIAFNTFWLFSKRTIAPIKNKPIAAGSE